MGFGFGLLVFQALFMRDMLGGSYLRAVRSTVFAEWLSMNCVMGAMVAVIVIIHSHVPGAQDAAGVRFWTTFSLAVLAGLAFAYPVNVWLVANHLKHGMGMVRVLGEGGEPVHEPPAGAAPAGAGMTMPQTEVTGEHKAAMATLTVVFLASGVLLAAIFGRLG
ncbi:DUF4396 domain-containing protein [Streptomyces sp. NPDC002896]|uniref:DUF4396 domain-containing protein n=1 Tax=Streptomyces sp. NPDC002896 TaxID=3154438 RepID=UPI00331AF77C